MSDTVVYYHLQHEDYKRLEKQMKEFNETTHTSVPGPFYHKSIRLKVSDHCVIEFHGSLVHGGNNERQD